MAAQSAAATRGGLSRAVAEALGRSSWGPEPKGLAVPRPRPVHARPAWFEEAPEEPEGTWALTSSNAAAASGAYNARCDDPSAEAGLAELRRMFAAECSLGTSAPGFGVSPPVRSGAANGLVHDSMWRQDAPRACKASLRVLHERAGPRCLTATTSCAGDYRLLMTSPEQSLPLLAGAVEGDEAEELAAARSLRASPIVGWFPPYCASPEPADLFSY